MTDVAQAADGDELRRLADEVRKLREAIEARPPFIVWPQPYVIPQPYITHPWWWVPPWFFIPQTTYTYNTTTDPFGPRLGG